MVKIKMMKTCLLVLQTQRLEIFESKATVDNYHAEISVEEVHNASNKHSSKNSTQGRKKFNHYSFDIHKTPFEKAQSFMLILRVKSSFDKTEGSAAELYNKINTYQPEQRKVAAGEDASKTDKTFQLPVRRFLFAAEINHRDVKLHCYNIKEDIKLRILEKLSEEITFHEIRETIIFGLTNPEAMRKLAKTGLEESEQRVNQRIDKVEVAKKTIKKQQEFGINLKYSKDIRFGLDKSKLGMPSTSQPLPTPLTLTATIQELLKKEHNSDLPFHEQLRYTRRSDLKKIISKVIEMISVCYTKIKAENMPLVMDSKPDLIKADWENLQSEYESENDSHSIDISPTNHSPQTSHSGNYLNRKPGNDKSATESVFTAGTPTLVTHSVSPDHAMKKSFNYNAFKKDKNVGSSANPQLSGANALDDSDMDSEIAGQEPDSIAQDSYVLKLDMVPTEVDDTVDSQNIDLTIERVFYNIEKLKENFYLHLFDFKVRNIFQMDEKSYTSFEALKSSRNLGLISPASHAARSSGLLPGQKKHHGLRK